MTYIYLILLLFTYSCTSVKLDKDLLVNLESIKNNEYILYSLTHFSWGYPTKPVPQLKTQYLMILKDDENEKSYFELFKYSNYNKPIKLRDIRDYEFDKIKEIINSIKNNLEVNCERSSAYENRIVFTFDIKFNGINDRLDEIDMVPNRIPELIKSHCLSEYLKTIFFFREYEADTQFDEH
ncbi:MAG: hypothetical protein CVV25_10765 [Ignavibacteriae bacterium HGW-Ignavibacteriae-4]|jgi:hypothetical protein|nr:MAG: hypothetical protein CVV25_10765 [Ignavibacteriae bacterium HGW-Ignavibacteriae-4]